MLLPLLLRLPSEHATVSGDVAPPASVTVTVAVAVAVVTEPAAILGCRRAPPGGPGGDVKPKLARAREPPDHRQLAYGAMTAAASDDYPRAQTHTRHPSPSCTTPHNNGATRCDTGSSWDWGSAMLHRSSAPMTPQTTTKIGHRPNEPITARQQARQ